MELASSSRVAPGVSVILPVYNGERDLAQAIESILAQTFADFELIIVDDGSTDNTASILEQYAARDQRIRVLRNSVNRGIGPTLNRGIESARGEFIARQDADDWSIPGRLALQVAFLRDHPDHFLVGSQIRVLREDNASARITHYPLDHEAILEAFIHGCCIGHGSVMFRRIPRMMYTWEGCPAEDYELWTRMIRLGKFANLAECLYHYRLWHNSISVRRREAQRAVAARSADAHRRNLAIDGRYDILLKSYLRGNLAPAVSRDVGDLLRAARMTRDQQRALRSYARADLLAFRTDRYRVVRSFAVLRHCLGNAAGCRWLVHQLCRVWSIRRSWPWT